MYWINVAQDRGNWQDFMNMAMNARVPYNVGKWFRNSAAVAFSIRAPKH
jgi:hypothetical protein